MSEISELKRVHLDNRRVERDKNNVSILEQFPQSLSSTPEVIESEAKVDISTPPPKCTSCNGSGYLNSLFSRWECSSCHGTRYDLGDPLAVIRWQQSCMDWSKQKINRLNHQLLVANKTEAQLTEEAMERMYERGRTKD